MRLDLDFRVVAGFFFAIAITLVANSLKFISLDHSQFIRACFYLGLAIYLVISTRNLVLTFRRENSDDYCSDNECYEEESD